MDGRVHSVLKELTHLIIPQCFQIYIWYLLNLKRFVISNTHCCKLAIWGANYNIKHMKKYIVLNGNCTRRGCMAFWEHPFNLKGGYDFFRSKKKNSVTSCRYIILFYKNNYFIRHDVLSDYFFCPYQRQNFFSIKIADRKMFPQKTIAPPPHPSSSMDVPLRIFSGLDESIKNLLFFVMNTFTIWYMKKIVRSLSPLTLTKLI